MTRDTATYGHMYVQIQHERVTCSSSENPAKFPNTLLPSLSLSLSLTPHLKLLNFMISLVRGTGKTRRKKRGEAEEEGRMRKSFKDSLKALEADIQFANTLASEYSSGGASFQMRLSYSPAAQFFLFLVQWTDCHLAGALGLLRILIYKAYEDGKTTISIYERKASLKEFYGVVFPSLLQLHRGITDVEDRKQKHLCATKYKLKDLTSKGKFSETDNEREEECGICLEINSMVVLPNCYHSMCMECYQDWHARSQSCPFCRDSLKRVNSDDLWIYISSSEINDLASINKENLKRLFMYIESLPVIARSYIHHLISSPLVIAN